MISTEESGFYMLEREKKKYRTESDSSGEQYELYERHKLRMQKKSGTDEYDGLD
jgi:hypothetical protein